MKSKNAKSVKKSKKKDQKSARKELREMVVSRMMDMIKGLGHSGEGLQKMVRKSTRKISRKLSEALDEGPGAAREKKLPAKAVVEPKSPSKVLKPVAKKELVKARKVVARVGTGSKKTLSSGVLTTSVAGPEPGDPLVPGETPHTPVTGIRQEGPPADEKSGEDAVSPS